MAVVKTLDKTQTRQLFFTVAKSPLRAIIDNSMVTPDNYMVLHRQQQFLGIKPKEKEEQDIFFIEHQLAYKCGKVLAESLSPTLVHNMSFSNDLKNQAFIFIGENDFDTRQDSFLPAHELEEKNIFDIYDRVTLQQLKRYGFKPTIAIENGYDYNDRVMFYLLVGLPLSARRNGYLTISKYKFQKQTVKTILAGGAKELVIDDVKKHSVGKFRKDLKAFVDKYEQLSQIHLDQELLTAVALDVFNKNRNIEALKSDGNLLRDMQLFTEKAMSFFQGSTQASEILNFIIRYHYLDLDLPTVSENNIKDVLIEKKAYARLTRIYSEKNQQPEERAKYFSHQMDALQKILALK